jgi:protein TonB
MNRSAPLAKLAFLGLSVALHGGLALVIFSGPKIEIDGASAGAVQARQGSSFTDFVAGAAATEAPKRPVQAPQSAPAAVKAQPVPTASASKSPTAQQAVPVRQAETIPALPVEATPPPDALPALQPEAPADWAEVAEATPAETTEAQRTDPTQTTPRMTEALTPEPPDQAAKAPPLKTLEAATENAVTESLRPTVRPERPPEPVRRVEKKPEPRQTQSGNARENAVAGTAQGSRRATANRQSGNAGRSAQAGNAAAANYQGQVMQRINRTRKPRVATRGAALVRFSIAGNGGLGGVSIARSSGSTRLDTAAVQMIRRAAPFPPPPPGAQTSFTITIQGR